MPKQELHILNIYRALKNNPDTLFIITVMGIKENWSQNKSDNKWK